MPFLISWITAGGHETEKARGVQKMARAYRDAVTSNAAYNPKGYDLWLTTVIIMIA